MKEISLYLNYWNVVEWEFFIFQTSAFLRGLFSSELATHCLILLPLTLLEQWKSHLRQWCPKATILIYHGSKSERRYINFWDKLGNIKIIQWNQQSDKVVQIYIKFTSNFCPFTVGNDSYPFAFSPFRQTIEICSHALNPIVVLTTYETFRNSAAELGRAPHYFRPTGLLTRMEMEALGQSDVEDHGFVEDPDKGKG